VTHLAAAEEAPLRRHWFIQLITRSPVQLVNEPGKSILFYAKYHLVFIMLELKLLGWKHINNHLAWSRCASPASLLA